MRIALKALLILSTWIPFTIAVFATGSVQPFPGKWLQQSLQPTKAIPKVKSVAPTAQPATSVWRKSVVRLSRHQVAHILAKTKWPRHLRAQAIKIVSCESGRRPHSVGEIDSQDIGLFQINLGWHRKKVPGRTTVEKEKNLKNPYTNARVALEVYRESQGFRQSGWKPWKASKGCHGFV